MHAAIHSAGEVPQHPAVGVAKDQVAGFGFGAGAFHVIQDPFDLGAGEVRGQRQAHLLFEALRSAVLGQFIHDVLGPGVLPDDGVVDRLARCLIPHDGGFALVGDADGGDVVPGQVRFGKRRGNDLAGVVPDFGGVVLHPAGLRKDLLVFHLAGGDDAAAVVEDDGARAGGALVDGDYVLVHVDVLVCCLRCLTGVLKRGRIRKLPRQ
ncbi:hypothetical protein D9M72_374790 [compost metagenome]